MTCRLIIKWGPKHFQPRWPSIFSTLDASSRTVGRRGVLSHALARGHYMHGNFSLYFLISVPNSVTTLQTSPWSWLPVKIILEKNLVKKKMKLARIPKKEKKKTNRPSQNWFAIRHITRQCLPSHESNIWWSSSYSARSSTG